MKKEEISDFLTTKNNTNRDRDKLGKSFKLLCSDEGNFQENLKQKNVTCTRFGTK